MRTLKTFGWSRVVTGMVSFWGIASEEQVGESVFIKVEQPEGAEIRLNSKDIAQIEGVSEQRVKENYKISTESIKCEVANVFGITIEQMNSKKRPWHIARARMAAMMLCREIKEGKYPKYSLTYIGDAFGGRDHGTVLHACRRVREEMETNQEFMRKMLILFQSLKIPSPLPTKS